MILELLLAGAIAIATLKIFDSRYPWVRRDLYFIRDILATGRRIQAYNKRKPAYTIVDKFVDQAKEIPSKIFVYCGYDSWSYLRMNEYSNQVARLMHQSEIRNGATVALLMRSCPEFIGVWFGIAKTGAVTAFINHNLRGKQLLHCIKISECKILVIEASDDLMQAVSPLKEDLENEGVKLYIVGTPNEEPAFRHTVLDEMLENQSKSEIPLDWREDVTIFSNFAYVFTSGTTGLPKAALIRFERAVSISNLLHFSGANENDVLYSPLPLYHASAGLIGVLGTIELGCSMAVRTKFSASQFWSDCRKYNATVIQYIGETMRYVCDTPETYADKDHSVRIAIGNGLRPQVWRKFSDRFGESIRVAEFYAASEGPFGSMNLDNHFGSIGSWSPVMQLTGLIKLVKYDKENDEICRDSSGRCIEVPDGTPGLLLSKITCNTPFHGYHGNKKQTESKIIRNAFKDGDCYFNSGDLIRRDEDYHLFFVDRLGDTFRWKGENVSTNEVADILAEAPSIIEANVYGVEIAGKEGRAGMAVIRLKDEFDAEGVYKHVIESLAPYACPLFLRVRKKIELTGTYKLKKVQFVNEGCNPDTVGDDQILFLDHSQRRYIPFTADLYERVITNTIKI